MDSDAVQLGLSKDEALVFFEWLVRFNGADGASFEDQAEQVVLRNIEALLEKTLLEPFQHSYSARLSEARNRLRQTD